ncbi:WD40/YVTN repeat-like-containing domain [Plasmopara halstedii]|uniref:Cilia- and flagella-associated protein 43 n=1 Tax=Plasmopara halstedii TaxID=4781 RepID=A0A0P1B4M1_PLAHL|nr:WD40/YVTN repeat-like-containing domain [Plasmopara halstedii]CEG49326.1 WD40/YVTN repeat-like-containing domain [Plasmopara halstedii]|eukprot:XP_024585695.1 WD40/YVTN repeat-like-containing domain [Plasmopara halstedii]
MSVDASIRHIFGYDGSAKNSPSLQLVDESTIVYVSGYTMHFTCTPTGRQHFLLRSQPRKLVTFDCNWTTSTFAIATREPHAPISLYSYPEKKLISQLRSNDAQVFEHSLIKFSHCGHRLLSIQPAPPIVGATQNSTLCVWDIETLSPINGCEHASIGGSPRFASFDPANNNQFVVGGNDGLEIWKVYAGKTTASSLLRPRKVALFDFPTEVIEPLSDVDMDEKHTQFLCHAWIPNSQLLVADNAGNLLLVDATKVRVVHVVKTATRPDQCCIVGIVVTMETAVVVYTDGAVAWLQMHSWELVYTEMITCGALVTAIAPTPSYAKAYIGTQNGKIFEIRTNVLQDNEDDSEIEEDGTTQESARSQSKRGSDNSAFIALYASFPTGPVCDSTVVTPFGGTFSTDALIATGGINGRLTLWNLQSCQQAAEVDVAELFAQVLSTSEGSASSPEAASTDIIRSHIPSVMITALASRPANPIAVVGDHQGRLRFLCIAKIVDGVEVLPQHSIQALPPDAPLDIVVLHPTYSVLLVASTHSGQVLLLSMDHEKRFPVLAFFTFENPDERVVDIQWNCSVGSSLTLTCFSSRGLFYSTRFESHSEEERSVGSTSSGHGDVSLREAIQLYPNVVASGQGIVSMSTRLRILAGSSSSMMIAASPHHTDLILLKYRDVSRDSTSNMSILSKVLIRQAHSDGISALAHFPRVLENDVELLVTGGMDGSLTFWTLYKANGRRSTESAADTFDELEALQAIKKRTLMTHYGPMTTLQFVFTNENISSERNDFTKIQLISTGIDGCVFLFDVSLSADLFNGSVNLIEAKSADPPLLMKVLEATYQPELEQDRTPFIEAFIRSKTITDQDISDPSKERTRLKLRELEEQLEGILAKNEQLPENEKLSGDEFVLNVAWRDSLLSQHAARAERIREEITRDVARMAIIRERMKREFWDEAEVPGIRLNALSPSSVQQYSQSNGHSASFFVNNFPLRRKSLSEQKTAKQIATLRMVELAHQNDEDPECQTSKRFQATVPSDLQWVLNAVALRPKVQLGTNVTEKTQEYLSWPSFNFIYHPVTVRTRKQAQVQMHLVRCYARELQRAYNLEFSDLVRLKETILEQIETKNDRIVQILTELKVNVDAGDLYQPQWGPEETAESILSVMSGEMNQSKYEPPECRNQRKHEAHDTTERKMSRGHDNDGERALIDMMDGTLEIRKDPLAAQELVKESWMLTIPPDEMTVEQKKLVLQFEAAKAKFEDDREKYRKSLDLELRKTRVDVMELCRTFDGKLRALHDRYMATQGAVLAQELYELQLGEEIRRREELKLVLRNHDDEARDLQEAEAQARSKCDQFATQLEICRDDLHRASEEDKLLEKNFVRDLEEMVQNSGSTGKASASQLDSPDFMKHLVELYRKRKPNDLVAVAFDLDAKKQTTSMTRVKGSAKQRLLAESLHGEGGSLSNLPSKTSGVTDSMVAHASRGPLQYVSTLQSGSLRRERSDSRSQPLVVAPLDYATDRPAGVLIEDRFWRALNSLRAKKIIAEHAVQEQSEMLALAKTINDELRSHLLELQQRRKNQQQELESSSRQYTALTESAPLLVRIKQGQDECQVKTTRDDALLVSRMSVEALNEEIQMHGNDQVSILGRIKDFRKSINVMEWEHALLELQTRDMDEQYTDIQLLRVTKELQELLHSGDTSHKQKRQVAMLEAKLTHLSRNHETTVLKLEKTGSQYERQLRERERENDKLEQQVTQLTTQVKIREDILTSRTSAAKRQQAAGGGARKDATRLKAIAVRRKLVDLAKAQTNEIEYLRSELDKMRRRTFPSFAQTHIREYNGVD